MSYQAPYIDESGYHYPSYQEILADMVSGIQTICGQDVYLGSDSMDYQIISLFALKVYDCYQAVELAYNSHSPVTAIGTALDYIVALNGITRTQGTKSKATLTLTCDPGTKITGGIVSDTSGVLWDLDDDVTVADEGSTEPVTVSVGATCRVTGIVIAEAGAICNIMTPTKGWLYVTNPAAATTGTVVESDSALRARQALAVAEPSQSIVSGLKAALLELTDVSRVEVIENDTDAATEGGAIAAHSVCCIVDGSFTDDTEADYDAGIARTILNHKSMGCGTSGQRSVSITDSTGETYAIKYTRPEKVEIDVAVTIKLIGSGSYSTEYYKSAIQTKVIEYVSTYAIGKDFVPAMLYSVIQAINDDSSNPQFYISSLTAKTGSGTASLDPIAMAYYQYAYADVDNVTVTVE